MEVASSSGATTTKSMSVFVWSPTEMSQSAKTSLPVKVAIGFVAFAFFFIIIAFSTSAWLETDGDLPSPKFIKIGN
jgi:hypothetical protein